MFTLIVQSHTPRHPSIQNGSCLWTQILASNTITTNWFWCFEISKRIFYLRNKIDTACIALRSNGKLSKNSPIKSDDKMLYYGIDNPSSSSWELENIKLLTCCFKNCCQIKFNRSKSIVNIIVNVAMAL